MTTVTLPPGAMIAAERAYAALDPARRRSPSQVAEALLRASVPFLAPAVAQLGRCRLTPAASRTVFHAYLAGATTRDLADRYSVTPQTIGNHIRRHMTTLVTRYRSGVPLPHLARETSTRTGVLLDLIHQHEGRTPRGPSGE